jgi:long-chain acyl-CoA synthetase
VGSNADFALPVTWFQPWLSSKSKLNCKIKVVDNRPFRLSLVRPITHAELLATQPARPGGRTTLLLQHVADVVKARPAYATPKLVWWTLEPWSIEAGLITPTLKNERPALECRLAGGDR